MVSFAPSPASPASYLPGSDADFVPVAGGDVSARVEAVIEFVAAKGFVFAPWQIATFITAARAKPFVILAGISGTGKSKLPQLVAEATDAYCEVIPVRPDWTDSSDLLGYERLDGEFIPGHLLRLCRRAIDEPDRQFFFVLDEMNVARVEYYFAEVLSLMENRYYDGDAIRSAPLLPSAPSTTPEQWGSVWLPSNVCLVGTVNMDESTHGFSRKVLDRSFVIELSDVDLNDFGSVGTPSSPTHWPSSQWVAKDLTLGASPDVASDTVTRVIQGLTRANEALSKAQLQVGYRVRDEVALFCLRAADCASSFVASDESLVSPLDLCISMKILPRVQGGDVAISDVLSDLSSWAEVRATSESEGEEPAGFPRSAERVSLMRARLERTGFTSYWL